MRRVGLVVVGVFLLTTPAIPAAAAAGVVTEYSLSGATSGPQDLAVGPDGNVWVTEFLGDKIARISPAGAITEFSITSFQPTGAAGITAGPDGAMWFAERYSDQIGRISMTGVVTEFPASNISSSGLKPSSVATGSDGALWYVEQGRDRIGRMRTDGSIAAEYQLASHSSPGRIVAGPDGDRKSVV